MPASAIPAVIDWLLGDLATTLSADDVDLCESWPGDKIQRCTVVIGNATFDHTVASMGSRKHIEDATLSIWVLVELPGGTATEVRRKAFAIFDVIAEKMRTDLDAVRAGGSTCWTTFTPTEWTPGLGDHARTGLLRCELRTHNARI